MTASTARSVRDVDDETREAVIGLARRSGLSLADLLRAVAAEEAAGHPPPKEDAGLDPASLARLDRRLREIEQSSDGALDALRRNLGQPGVRPDDHGRTSNVSDMLATLARALENPDEIARTEIEGLPRRPARRDQPPRDQGTPPDASLADVRHRLNDLLNGHTEAPPLGAASRIDDALRRLQDRVEAARSALAARPGRPSPARATTPGAQDRDRLAAAIEQISRRQVDLDEDRSVGGHPRFGGPSEQELADLGRDIAAIGDRVAVGRRERALPRTEHDRLMERLDQITATGREDLAAFRNELRTMLDDRARETGHDRARLEALAHELNALRETLNLNDDTGSIGLLQAEVAELRNAVEQASRTASDTHDQRIERLEWQINEIAGVLENVAEASAEGAAREVKRLESQVADLAATLERFLVEAANGPREDLQRLEAQVAQLTGLVETAVTAVNDAAQGLQASGVENRIDALAADVATLAGSSPPADALEGLSREISAIRDELGSLAALDPARLEHQIAQLASRIDSVATGDGSAGAPAEPGAQGARITEAIDGSEIDGDVITRLEDRLADMQALLAHNEAPTVDAARVAASAAGRQDTEARSADVAAERLVADLRTDLEALKATAASGAPVADQDLSTLSETMAEVTARLAELESRVPPTTPIPGIQLPPAAPAAAADKPGGDDRKTQNAPEPPDDARSRRSDFIAAARRAAQAAAAESQTVERARPDQPSTAKGERRPGPLGRMSHGLKSRRKALLLAAAAVIIALGAVQLFGWIDAFGPGDPAVRGDQVMTSTEATSSPAPLPAAATASTERASPPPLVAPTFDTSPAPVPTFDPDPTLAFAPPGDVGSRFVAAEPPADPVTISSLSENPRERSIGPPALFEAARAGDAAAAYEIGTRYADGAQGRDMATARRWFTQAAEGGLAVAQYRLGSLSERGIGGDRDLAAALDWYQRAADQGNVSAMHNLAVLLSEGVNGPPDHAKALQWFTAAADHGVTDSQYNLGVVYARGLGAEPDPVQAYKWFAIAAGAGDTDSAERRDEVAATLTPDELGQARALARIWSKKPAPGDANAVTSAWKDTSELSPTDRRTLVSNVQALLRDRGYDPGPADGVVGPRTREAVVAFQRRIGQTPTGKIDPALVSALSRNG